MSSRCVNEEELSMGAIDSIDSFVNRRSSRIGFLIIVLGNCFAAHEMVPGWGFNLHLPDAVIYAAAIGSGAWGGALIGGRYFVPGVIGGALAGLGALFLEAWHLRSVHSTDTGTMALIAMAGMVPGTAMAVVLGRRQKRMMAAREQLAARSPSEAAER
jgi:hypothetical protein